MINLLAKSASAGSGKTTALVFRYITLLLKGAKLSEVIALTFTVKAANNMKERIVTALLDMPNYIFLRELSLELDMPVQKVLEEAAKISQNISFTQMKISTLDSFFSSILSKFCFYAGVPYGFETLESSDLDWLRRKFLGSLSPSQTTDLAAYLSSHRRKLAYFFELFALFDEKNLDPRVIFWRHDVSEMESISEANHLIAIISYGLVTERERNLFAFDTIEELSKKNIFSYQCLNDHSWLKKKQFSPEQEMAFEGLKELIKKHFWRMENIYADTIIALFDSYKNAKYKWLGRDGKLSFSDVSISVHKLLCSSDALDTDFLYFRLDSKINHILIDEFQDTSLLQYEIIKPLIDEVSSGIGQSEFASFFFVGDVKQSIYRFRGGFSQLFDFVARGLEPNGLVIEKLNTNYRSDKNIVEFANSIFQGALPSYERQESAVGAEEGFVEVLVAPITTADDEDAPNTLIMSVLEKIDLLVKQGVLSDDIAVLTPTNADSIAVIEAIREQAKYHATQEVSAKVVEQKEPKAIINYLKYCLFGDDIFREIFFAHCGIDAFGEVKKLDTKNTPTNAVSYAMHSFGLYSADALKLLEIASEYDDLYDFLIKIEKNSAKTPSGKSSGIRVLTVHKSKGLEFKYVICMDRLASKGQSGDDVLFGFDGLNVDRVFFRFSGRENFDAEYAQKLEAEKRLVQTDRLNMLYVAFTRAEKAMFIIKKPTNILKDGSAGAYTGVFDLKGVESTCIGTLLIPESKIIEFEAVQDIEFEAKYYGRQKLDDTKEEGVKDYAKIELGLALHSVMEMVDFDDIGGSINDSIAISKRKHNIAVNTEASLAQMSNKACKLVAKYLVDGWKAYKECSFVYRGKFGRMDLLLFGENGAVIIDYKSSIEISQGHTRQVQKYTIAVKDIANIDTQGVVLPLGA